MPDNLPQSAPPIKVMAVYKFTRLPKAETLVERLDNFCRPLGIAGTLILAHEGINGTVAGTPEAIDLLADFLINGAPFAGRLVGAEIKFSSASAMPFLRLKVRFKPEIVTLRAPEADPSQLVGTYVEPQDWNGLIERNDIVLVDTRNDYEVGLGSFQRALDPKTKNFTEFKDYVAKNLDPARDKKVAMFCTGGIRCEKASAYLLTQGFEEVFHLKGGILKYLETVPQAQSRWHGECFVFDERVAVGHGLVEGEASLCRACRHPLTEADRAAPQYQQDICCPYCADEPHKHAAAAERHRQIELAKARGLEHMGDASHNAAQARKLAKQERAAAERARARTQKG